jgi:WD40 repeat protein
LWDVTNAAPLQAWKHDYPVTGALFTCDESRVLSWSVDGAVKLWDVTHVEPLQVWKHDGPVTGALFTPDDSRVLSWSADGALNLWDASLQNPSLTPAEQVLELEVRSATRLGPDGQPRTLTSSEWQSRAESYAEIRARKKSAGPGGTSGVWQWMRGLRPVPRNCQSN